MSIVLNGRKDISAPPMGWNSWDCYGASVKESEVRANAEYMAKALKEYGWEYIVVDIQWYEPNASSNEYNSGAELVMDEYSRLMPAENRFPSAEGGKGFAPLGDYIHSLGLKFGIHILRGIPRQAVRKNTAIMGTDRRAAEIADIGSICEWNSDMCGVYMSREGAQEYYDSLFELYASWGVDLVKVDDIARPYHPSEVEAIRKAIDKTGRQIVLSLSPGDASLSAAEHLCENANMWRITDDFWDAWEPLRKMFDYCRGWFPYTGEGHFPDCDMLPLGKIGIRSLGGARMTNFTEDEQKLLMSLWCIFRSPLMFGGDMVYNDDFTLSLMQNKELIAIDQRSHAGRELYRKGSEIVWAANGEKGVYYLAQFNIGEVGITAVTPLSYLGIEDRVSAVELWTGEHAEVTAENEIVSYVAPHGVCIYKISIL